MGKKLFKVSTAFFLALSLFFFSDWIFHPYWMTRTAWSLSDAQWSTKGLRIGRKTIFPGGSERVFSFDTYNDKSLTQKDIICIFDQTVSNFTRKTNVKPVYLIRTDSVGWDHLCAVWELPNGYAVLEAGSGNDNDNIHFHFEGATPSTWPYSTTRPGSRQMLETIFAR